MRNIIDNNRNVKRIATFILIVLVMAFFWMVFKQIDQQLNQFNHTVLKVVNNYKAQSLQTEFDAIERKIQQISSAVEKKQPELISFLYEQDSIFNSFTSIAIWNHKEGEPPRLAYYAVKNNFIPTNLNVLSVAKDTIRYKQGSIPQLEIYRKLNKDILLISIDLKLLQQHFESSSADARSYFELYDQNTHCLLHPDTSRIGKVSPYFGLETKKGDDIILESAFLGVPVLQSVYSLNGMFSNSVLIVHVPILMTDVEVKDIGSFSLLLSVSGILLMLCLIIILNVERRKSERLEMRNLAYQKEEALLKFENLKQKFDPHFLFNALGSLQQLIRKDPKLAQLFVGKLARVYRKFISTDENNLSTIKEEVQFAEEYFFLQKIRFGESLQDIKFVIKPEQLSYKIPKFSLQILIENAIKHNEISQENPLSIHCFSTDNGLIVENNLSPRVSVDSSNGYGTLLIAKVYDYYHVQGFSVEQDEYTFSVMLPLITV